MSLHFIITIKTTIIIMTIQIKDREVTLRYSFRSLILYENIQKKSFSPESTTDVLVYMFCVILGSDPEVELSFNEFLDMIDENPNLVVEFSSWLSEQISRQTMLSPEDEDDEKKKVKTNLK